MMRQIDPYMYVPKPQPVRVDLSRTVQQVGTPAAQPTIQSPQPSTFSQFLAGAHNPFSPESNLMNRVRQLRGF